MLEMSISRTARSTEGSEAAQTFALSTEVTEGPFYIPTQAIRANIAEDRSGVPFELQCTVVDVETQRPLAGAFVDVWTADGEGHYSGYLNGPGFGRPAGASGPPPGMPFDQGEIHRGPPPGPFGPPPGGFSRGGPPRGRGRGFRGGPPGRGGGGPRGGGFGRPPKPQPTDNSTFLRGVQPTNEHGRATFSLVFPGWYNGRTTHLHIKVLSARDRAIALHTGQLFFPEDVVSQVALLSPYKNNTVYRVKNDEDGIFLQAGVKPVEVDWVEEGTALVGRTTLGVKGSATVSAIDPFEEEGQHH